jgi:hypothetical protein
MSIDKPLEQGREDTEDFGPLFYYKDENGNVQPLWDLAIGPPDDSQTTDEGDKQ